MSRTSVLSMRARGSVDAQTPLRGYFLWVGGALLVLLFAADSLLPAPLPSKLIESHSTLPPIRIASERKGPEAVVIDTSQLGFLPTLPNREIAAAPSPPLGSDVADAVRQSPASLSEQAAKIPDEHETGGERRRTSMVGREQSCGVKSPNQF